MMIQPIYYSPDVDVNRAAQILVNNMAGAVTNPKHSTVGAIMRRLTKQFGDYAQNTRIPIH